MNHSYPEYFDNESVLLDMYARDYMQSALVKLLCRRLEEALDGERNAEEELERETEKLRDKHAEEVKALSDVIEDLESDNSSLSDDYDTACDRIEELEKEIAVLKSQLAEATYP